MGLAQLVGATLHGIADVIVENQQLKAELDAERKARQAAQYQIQQVGRAFYETPEAKLQLLPTADPEVAEAVYRHLALHSHPDRGGRTSKMQELNLAIAEIRRKHGQAS